MKTTHTFGIQFIIRSGKKDKDTELVYARITVETRRIEISLKKTIAVEEWNKARGMAKGFSPEAKKFNSSGACLFATNRCLPGNSFIFSR